MDDPSENDLIDEILTLSRAAWGGALEEPRIQAWLENFTGKARPVAEERLHALHLLRHLMYFGQREVRVLLRSIYRDLFKNPLIRLIRERNGDTSDAAFVGEEFKRELRTTRFVGMGNPADSGSHLLYYFRQENRLHRDLFVHPHQLLTGPAGDASTTFAAPGLNRVVFIDDLLGSGQQSIEYGRTVLRGLREVQRRQGNELELLYFVMFAKPAGMAVARAQLFDRVLAVHEFDDTQIAFSDASRVYLNADAYFSRDIGRLIAETYGSDLFPGNALGYQDGQMMLAMSHNVPDNTLPVFWRDEIMRGWSTVFTRYAKEVDW